MTSSSAQSWRICFAVLEGSRIAQADNRPPFQTIGVTFRSVSPSTSGRCILLTLSKLKKGCLFNELVPVCALAWTGISHPIHPLLCAFSAFFSFQKFMGKKIFLKFGPGNIQNFSNFQNFILSEIRLLFRLKFKEHSLIPMHFASFSCVYPYSFIRPKSTE